MKLYNKNTKDTELFLDAVLRYRVHGTNDSELAAFCHYACAFPNTCLCLIDTYDTVRSGLPNFIAIAKALDDFGYTPKGVRLDSGDLVSLSNECKQAFDNVVASQPERASAFSNLMIVASNDINERILEEFGNTSHSLTAYGIGTNLVTCQAQPALGCVYKLVECNGNPRIKLSQEIAKVTLPGRKRIYRFFGADDKALLDYMVLGDEPEPVVDNGEEGILCRHPFEHTNRLCVFPSKIVSLQQDVFVGGTIASDFVQSKPHSETRTYVSNQLSEQFSSRVTCYSNPTKYEVMVSPKLYQYLHQLWETNAPIPELR